MKPQHAELRAASETLLHPDARFALLQSLYDQLAVADALQLDLVAIRISEAIDQLMDELYLSGAEDRPH
jgi:hypothetical protein